jgi:DNA repair protein RecN (Recombination protein N)
MAGASKCVIEAEFDVEECGLSSFFSNNDIDFDGKTCIVRRELTAAGKSRSFVNDSPAPLSLLKELGDKLIDIHSQHQNLLLNKENFQLGVLDIIGNNTERFAAYSETYKTYKSLCSALERAVEDARRNSEDEEFVRFQYEQLESANLVEGEQDLLEAESDILTHAEDIKGGLYRAKSCLASESDSDDALQMLKQCASALHGVENLHVASAELANRIDSCYIELKDIAEEIENHIDSVEYNPERLVYVNDRLSLIYSLEKKHKVESLEELLVIKDDLEARLNSISHSDENIEILRKERDAAYSRVVEEAEALSKSRRCAAEVVQSKMTDYLLPLGMPNVRFSVDMSLREAPDATGLDKVAFLFSANKNSPMQDVSSVASGGEIARVMLSLKALIAGAVQMPTIIFDEIDTGVSGAIAEKMAHIMQEMGANDRQVISITHLPQIAALGSHHYKVYKVDNDDATISHIVELDKEQRVTEIANMLSGENITDAAISNAKELLGISC